MRNKHCVLYLVCLTLAFVHAETSIEIDEIGDQYEIKRFDIEGRHLENGRSQCVVTRRKRSLSGTERHAENLMKKDPEYYTSATTTPESVEHMPMITLQPQIEHTSGAEESLNSEIVVQTNSPPKVNPQTHALFELLPINPLKYEIDNMAADEEIRQDEDNDKYDEGFLHYEEEISPVSTTAIWSTGIDDDFYDDMKYNNVPVQGVNNRRTTKRPLKFDNKISSNKNNKLNNVARPNKKSRRPGNMKKSPLYDKRGQGHYNVLRSRPVIKGNIIRVPNTNNYNNGIQTKYKIKHHNKNLNKYSNRRINTNLNNRDIKHTKFNKLEDNFNGSNTFTKSQTLTQTGSADEDRDVNCIIIRKDLPQTTERPFRNILGRSVGAPNNRYGKRKRTNMRLNN